MLKLGFLLTLGVLVTLAKIHEPFYVKFQWNYINYTWPSAEAYNKAKKDGSYIERNNVISGVKVYKNRMYLTIPRWKSGVPVTLASISVTQTNGETAPQLEPFPNWAAQKEGNCAALQSVQNVEIDPKGRMWILDSGRVMDDREESFWRSCQPSLTILDLKAHGELLHGSYLPTEIADRRMAYLYDIVLDHEDGGMAYISDADPNNPGIIVFSLKYGTFWKISHHRSMYASPDAILFNVGKVPVSFAFNVHGLALSPASSESDRTLYYSSLSSLKIYSISTNVLKNKSLHADIDSHVKLLGTKTSQSDGIVMSNTGMLYFGLLAENAIATWDSGKSFDTGHMIISRDRHLMQWPASFAFDNRGTIWCITNRRHIFLKNSTAITEPNFRVIAANVGYTNYQYLANGSAPRLPEIAMASVGSLSSNASLALVNLLVLLLLVYFKL